MIASSLINCGVVYLSTQYVGNPPIEMPICVYNEDVGQQITRDFIESLNGSKLNVIECSYEESIKRAERAETIGYLFIKDGFAWSLKNLYNHFETAPDSNAAKRIVFYGDFSDRVKSYFAIAFLEKRLTGRIDYIRSKFNKTKAFFQLYKVEPIDDKEVDDYTFRLINDQLLSALMFFYAWYCMCNVCGLMLLEHSSGYSELQRTFGVTTWHTLSSSFITTLVVACPIFISCSAGLLWVFGVPLDWFAVRFLVLLYSTAIPNGTAEMLLFVITSDTFAIFWLIVAWHLTEVWFTGWIWPLESIPYFMEPFSYLFPSVKLIPHGRNLLTKSNLPFWGDLFLFLFVYSFLTLFLTRLKLK